MDLQKNLHLEVSKLIGEPINYQLPVPVELQEICNIETVEPGEKVYVYEDVDTDTDYVMAIDADGSIKTIRKTPLGDVTIPLTGLQSKLEYVNVDELLSKPDLKVLGRKKERISHAMDKSEVKAVLDGIIAGGENAADATALDGAKPENADVSSVAYESGDDIYDLILKAKQEIEDYGDNYVLLTGSKVQNIIDTYDKDFAVSHNYKVDLKSKLTQLGIKEVKIWGKVEKGNDAGSTPGEARLLADTRFILVAKNSRVAAGKPITFVRRRISAEIANLMGADVDRAQRANIAIPTPVQDAGNKLAIGVYGYESIAFVIPQPKTIVNCDCAALFA